MSKETRERAVVALRDTLTAVANKEEAWDVEEVVDALLQHIGEELHGPTALLEDAKSLFHAALSGEDLSPSMRRSMRAFLKRAGSPFE